MKSPDRNQKELGVALIENIPPEISDSQLVDFFATIHDVESIEVLSDLLPAGSKRNCWINLRDPIQTLKELRPVVIAGNRFDVRLMGYLYPNQNRILTS